MSRPSSVRRSKSRAKVRFDDRPRQFEPEKPQYVRPFANQRLAAQSRSSEFWVIKDTTVEIIQEKLSENLFSSVPVFQVKMVSLQRVRLLLTAIQNLVQLYGAELSEKLKYTTSTETKKNHMQANPVTVQIYTFRFN